MSLLESEMLLRGNPGRGVGICLLLLALVHEATGQRKKAGQRNNYRLHDDGVGDGNSLYEVSTCWWGKLVTGSCGCNRLQVGGSDIYHTTSSFLAYCISMVVLFGKYNLQIIRYRMKHSGQVNI